jgi:hypothetical protein
MATASRRTAAAKSAPVEEPDEDEFEEDVEEDEDGEDLEELEEADDEPAPKAKAKRKPPVQPVIEHGSPWLAAYVTEQTGETYDARSIRMLLRKLAADGKLSRVVGEDRARYEFSGPKDPTVAAVLAMVKSGEAKQMKQAGLQKVKDAAAAKKAAAKAKVEDPEEMDEVEEAPKPRTRRTASKPAAPAKAAPATRRRAASAK